MLYAFKTQNSMKKQLFTYLILMVFSSFLFLSCNKRVLITSGSLQIEFDKNLYSKVNATSDSMSLFTDAFQLTEYLETKNFKSDKFTITGQSKSAITDKFGEGVETIVKGRSVNGGIQLTKIVSVKTYTHFPNMAVFDVSYVNNSQKDVELKKWVTNNYSIRSNNDTPNFWAFQGSSSAERADWIKPLEPGYYQKNFMGMNQSDYGGGIPVTDIWRKDGGIAIGHTEMVPKEVSLPTDFDKYNPYVKIGVEKEFDEFVEWIAGDTLKTFSTFVMIHKGDYYSALRQYAQFMQKKGIEFAEREDAAFESVWCGWGYERKFTTDEIIQTLPKVKELGIQWAVIDDGFQVAEGDWSVDKNRFPGGNKAMKKMVDAIHAHGLKAKLWWAPLAADPDSKILKEEPDVLLINKSGAPQYITWWDSYLMSPASNATIEHTKNVVDLFIKEWGFDGLKLDGQHMNAAPADYNWNRPLVYPEQSIEMLPDFFKMIYEEVREIKPHAVIENCPCGTCMSFYNMPFTNQTVSSDPLSSWQIRHKGKTYKAIMPHTAYYGDHVELSDNASDFASSLGIGAVLGTKFTWPNDNPYVKQSYLLTPEKEVIWKKWFDLYHEKMLSKEDYLGYLYDIGYDKPETHVIEKNDTLYYAFYAKEWEGTIELRGLQRDDNYSVFDYVNNVELATISGNNPFITAEFNDYLLIQVSKN